MEDQVIRIPGSNKGASYYNWLKRFFTRSDLALQLTHLTRPKQEDLNIIEAMKLKPKDRIFEIHKKAVDVLISILADQTILGSTTKSGFIIGNRSSACFQELPLIAIRQNVNLDMQGFINNNNKLRYCGVGISFDRFYVYDKGGRPVIYEEKEKAMELLNYNENEYWRIVNLQLKRIDPRVENLFGPASTPIITHDLSTTIIDWTHEREWRVPDCFNFNLGNDFRLNNRMSLIFPDRDTFGYFLTSCEDHNSTLIDQNIYYGLIDIAFDTLKPNSTAYGNYNIFILDEL